jgi:hypothetical protein
MKGKGEQVPFPHRFDLYRKGIFVALQEAAISK